VLRRSSRLTVAGDRSSCLAISRTVNLALSMSAIANLSSDDKNL
jgi:hypothetical protein